MKEYFSLDLALYEYAEKIFDERLMQMRKDQAEGMRCRLVESGQGGGGRSVTTCERTARSLARTLTIALALALASRVFES